ncbi:MAG: DUF6514 family protein [Oscillospiraceae bacterium]|nr:DUF6514 family protein [Oscillospiraceae bacterium]
MGTQKISFQITSRKVANDNGEVYVGYGFRVFDENTDEELFSADDLSREESSVMELIELIRQNDVCPCHFMDVVEDFLTLLCN